MRNKKCDNGKVRIAKIVVQIDTDQCNFWCIKDDIEFDYYSILILHKKDFCVVE